MTITELKNVLELNPEKKLSFILPNREAIPAHFHITEVGHVQKDFIAVAERTGRHLPASFRRGSPPMTRTTR